LDSWGTDPQDQFEKRFEPSASITRQNWTSNYCLTTKFFNMVILFWLSKFTHKT